MKNTFLSSWVLIFILLGCKSEESPKKSAPFAKAPTSSAKDVARFGDNLIISDGLTGSTALSPIASWNQIDKASAYEVSIGTIPGMNDIKDWVSVGEVTSVSLSIFSTLVNGQVYYTNVRAINLDGSIGSVKSGDGWVAVGEWKIDTFAKRFNDIVYKTVFDKDQNQYFAGDFSSINPTGYNNIIMLDSNGVVDRSIDFGTGFNSYVSAKFLASGKIMVGGQANLYKGNTINKLIRLNSDGSVDSGFNLDTVVNHEIQYISNVEVDALGSTYIIYSTRTGVTGYKVAKINSDGSLNNDFETIYGDDRLGGHTHGLTVTSDNKLILSDIIYGVRVIDSDATMEIGLTSDATFAKKLSNGNLLLMERNKITMIDSSLAPVSNFNNNISIFTSSNHYLYGALETSDGGIIVYGDADETFNGIKKFLPSGLEDTAFNSLIGTGVIYGDQIIDVAKTSDNKFVVKGNFRAFNSQSVSFGITKLNSNGSRDSSFIPTGGGFNWGGGGIDILSNGKILASSSVYTFGGTRVNSLVKIKKDKTIDQLFSSNFKTDGFIKDVVIHNNSIWIAGHFTRVNGHVANGIAKLRMDGTIDTSFNARGGFKQEYPDKLTILKDGNLLLTGGFVNFNNFRSIGIVKVLKDGSRDATFNVGSGFNSTVNSVEELADGKLIIGGDFTSYKGVTVNRIIKLFPNASIDQSFNSGIGFNGSVKKHKVLPNGKILAYGYFTNYQGQTHLNLIKLNGDGSVDQDFDVGNSLSGVAEMVFTQDNHMIFAGNSGDFNGTTRGPIFRVNFDGVLDQSLDTSNMDEDGFSNIINVDVAPDGRIFLFGYFADPATTYSYKKEISW